MATRLSHTFAYLHVACRTAAGRLCPLLLQTTRLCEQPGGADARGPHLKAGVRRVPQTYEGGYRQCHPDVMATGLRARRWQPQPAPLRRFYV
jgi:hypothetical protein